MLLSLAISLLISCLLDLDRGALKSPTIVVDLPFLLAVLLAFDSCILTLCCWVMYVKDDVFVEN